MAQDSSSEDDRGDTWGTARFCAGDLPFFFPPPFFGGILKITKGTSSFGKHCNKIHTLCRQSGTYSLQKSSCEKCGYPAKCKKKYNWRAKVKRCNTTGTGRVRYLKKVCHIFRNEGMAPKPQRAAAAASISS
nr:60S ribosomal protein L37-like [Pogona vitticeps]